MAGKCLGVVSLVFPWFLVGGLLEISTQNLVQIVQETDLIEEWRPGFFCHCTLVHYYQMSQKASQALRFMQLSHLVPSRSKSSLWINTLCHSQQNIYRVTEHAGLALSLCMAQLPKICRKMRHAVGAPWRCTVEVQRCTTEVRTTKLQVPPIKFIKPKFIKPLLWRGHPFIEDTVALVVAVGSLPDKCIEAQKSSFLGWRPRKNTRRSWDLFSSETYREPDQFAHKESLKLQKNPENTRQAIICFNSKEFKKYCGLSAFPLYFHGISLTRTLCLFLVHVWLL